MDRRTAPRAGHPDLGSRRRLGHVPVELAAASMLTEEGAEGAGEVFRQNECRRQHERRLECLSHESSSLPPTDPPREVFGFQDERGADPVTG